MSERAAKYDVAKHTEQSLRELQGLYEVFVRQRACMAGIDVLIGNVLARYGEELRFLEQQHRALYEQYKPWLAEREPR